MKFKVITEFTKDDFEQSLNAFLDGGNKEVLGLNLSTGYQSGDARYIAYTAVIRYEEKRNRLKGSN